MNDLTLALHLLVRDYWHIIILVLSLVVGASAAIHAAMTKNDVRAAISWVGVIIMSPLLGPVLYLIAGINRVRRKHLLESRDQNFKDHTHYPEAPVSDVSELVGPQFRSLHILGDRVSRFQLRNGNHIQVLAGGDMAYPAMLEAINQAQHTIALQSYIFDNDPMGKKFVHALAEAHDRGVEIRVLIDAIGVKYSHPPIHGLLRRKGIRCALFMTNPLGMRMPYANLRSHRKILIIDGYRAFTGGMNIRAGFSSEFSQGKPAHDTHFMVEGPAVVQLVSSFAYDWQFTTGEMLSYQQWCADSWNPPKPWVPLRCIRSGPDRFIASTHHMLQGAFAVAQRHIRIQSPYFLPDQTLMGALNTAARRGIQVDILIPGQNNLKLVNYAMMAQLDQVLQAGCRVWLSSGAFDHSKLITIDGAWSYVGSSNMDPRSLRLNFELDIEVYCRSTARQIENLIDAQIEEATAISREDLAAQPFRKRLRNRIIWLFSPYL
ncbi:phospholipase D-like domain-containing protein [Alcaligenes endophyticus]|uniref:Phospholipase D-like domain-containing protein n=1 Tax=Alcaligenes endophyticus TaxID=1929088 RepID=A0ABT8EHC3_9BURK|nr:phospholipase D-like domain-containing protein [Alcaligenes endophyticus]MCX5589653.1 phospholipase D-like domain-containing protein [Alcaligenes endophyticus]MDN4120683.1 phospholipase D-like domain-containing protein [Alcaligenes endophyticus]